MRTHDWPGEGNLSGTAGTQTVCRNCGAHVTDDFARVFGDNQNRVYGCHECTTTPERLPDGRREPTTQY
jgi:hypothetical protein